MKSYQEDLTFFLDRIQRREYFSLSRFGDGEWAIIKKLKLDSGFMTDRNLSEFTTFDADPKYEISRLRLLNSLEFKSDGYYVGICPCYKEMLKLSRQDMDRITFANIFVNLNFEFFKKHFIEEFKKLPVHLVAHEDSLLENLPFKIEAFYPIKYNAWIENVDLIERISVQHFEGKLFLFCSGPLSNILSHELWRSNKSNFYLDIGSTLDLWLQTGNSRPYYLNDGHFSEMVCPCPKTHSIWRRVWHRLFQ